MIYIYFSHKMIRFVATTVKSGGGDAITLLPTRLCPRNLFPAEWMAQWRIRRSFCIFHSPSHGHQKRAQGSSGNLQPGSDDDIIKIFIGPKWRVLIPKAPPPSPCPSPAAKFNLYCATNATTVSECQKATTLRQNWHKLALIKTTISINLCYFHIWGSSAIKYCRYRWLHWDITQNKVV